MSDLSEPVTDTLHTLGLSKAQGFPETKMETPEGPQHFEFPEVSWETRGGGAGGASPLACARGGGEAGGLLSLSQGGGDRQGHSCAPLRPRGGAGEATRRRHETVRLSTGPAAAREAARGGAAAGGERGGGAGARGGGGRADSRRRGRRRRGYAQAQGHVVWLPAARGEQGREQGEEQQGGPLERRRGRRALPTRTLAHDPRSPRSPEIITRDHPRLPEIITRG